MFIVLSAIGLLLAGAALILMGVARLFGRVIGFAFGFLSVVLTCAAVLFAILAGIFCAFVSGLISIIPICLVLMLIIRGGYAILNRSK